MHATAAVPEFQFFSLRRICREEWLIQLAGVVVAFLLASIFLSGWPTGLIPEIRIPYAYSGDSLSSAWLTQRAMEGWIFQNERSGFPFGSSFLDYPGSDATSFLILKMLGMLTGSSAGAMNLYFLLGFPVNFLAAYLVLRSLRIGVAISFAAAILFAFAPFHFLRLGHIFYTWYFVVPIYFYIGLQVALRASQLDFKAASWRRRLLLIAGYLVMSGFGVYYTAFGMLVIAAGCAVALFNRSYTGIRFIAAPAIFFLAIGTVANLAPNVVNEHRLGHNPEVAARSPMESEVYGTKPMQMLLPRQGHRSATLAHLTERYNATTPLVNENATSTLGIFGVFGLAILALASMMGTAGARVDRRLSTLALISLLLLGFMVIGGLGSLFAHLVSPSIRGWNRASIFLSFSTLAALGLAAQMASTALSRRTRAPAAGIIALLMIALGLWDQTTPACTGCNAATKEAYELDKRFITKIERELPAGAALYQLPYMSFPEASPVNELHSYDLATGFIHSRELKWSFAGMKGREGDLFFRSLSLLPVIDQLQAIREKGFQAVYIDTRGYLDAGNEVINAWTDALGHGPNLVRADGKIVVFFVDSNPAQERKPSVSSENHAFAQPPLRPAQLGALLGSGWSAIEPWGVWSEGSSSTLRVPSPPQGTSHLRLQFNAFVPNGHTITIDGQIEGGEAVHMVATPEKAAGLTMDIPLPKTPRASVLTVSLKYDKPISPQQAGLSADARMIALGLTSLQWVNP
jgi:phosphoglycerol transferase